MAVQEQNGSLIRGADGELYRVSAEGCERVRRDGGELGASPDLTSAVRSSSARLADQASARMMIDPGDGDSGRMNIDPGDGVSSRMMIDSGDGVSARSMIDPGDGVSARSMIDPGDGPAA